MPFDHETGPSLLTLSETARRARISRRQVRNAIAAGELMPVFIAGRPWINAAECDRWRQLLQAPSGAWCGDAAAVA
jgi:hypothetical protein